MKPAAAVAKECIDAYWADPPKLTSRVAPIIERDRSEAVAEAMAARDGGGGKVVEFTDAHCDVLTEWLIQFHGWEAGRDWDDLFEQLRGYAAEKGPRG